jgi:hypothetical protein
MSEAIKKAVRSKYGSVAKSGLSTGHAGMRAVAEAFGYTQEQLASIPAEANMGLSCAMAAKRIGPTGKAIGMTPEMLTWPAVMPSVSSPSSPTDAQELRGFFQ